MALCLLPASALSAGEKRVRILIFSAAKPSAVTLTPAQGNTFVNGLLVKEPTVISARGALVTAKGMTRAAKSLRVDVSGKGAWLACPSGSKRLFRGELEISSTGGRLKIKAAVPLEDYIASVVSGEASDLSGMEALKAQAVAARTYTLKHRNNHKADGCDMCDSTHCQLFTGFASVRPEARAAADFTRGEVLTYKGKLAATFYHSICGGRTESMIYVWPFEHKPYLVSVKDGPERRPYCAIAPAFRWKTRISLRTLSVIARAQKWIGPDESVRKVAISERGISKRAAALTLYTGAREVRISATGFYQGVGRRAGWNAVRSTLFELNSGRDYLILEGRGSGHGVGMCQWGAEGMARAGFTYRNILSHYYPGTEVSYE